MRADAGGSWRACELTHEGPLSEVLSSIRKDGLTSQRSHRCCHLAGEHSQRSREALSSGPTDTLTRVRHELSVCGTQSGPQVRRWSELKSSGKRKIPPVGQAIQLKAQQAGNW